MKTKTRMYRNNGGGHVLADGTLIKKGQVFESHDPDLCTKFPNKFEEVPTEPTTTPPNKAGQKPTPTPDAGEETTEDDGDGDGDGLQDVTSEFPSAAENNLVVLRDKAGWWVYDDGEPTTEKALRKKDVEGAIKNYLGDA